MGMSVDARALTAAGLALFELVLRADPRSALTALAPALNDAEESLLSEAGRIANVHAISSASLFQRYDVATRFDAALRRAAGGRG